MLTTYLFHLIPSWDFLSLFLRVAKGCKSISSSVTISWSLDLAYAGFGNPFLAHLVNQFMSDRKPISNGCLSHTTIATLRNCQPFFLSLEQTSKGLDWFTEGLIHYQSCATYTVCSGASIHIPGLWSLRLEILSHLGPTLHEIPGSLDDTKGHWFSLNSRQTLTSGSWSNMIVHHGWNCLEPILPLACCSQTGRVSCSWCVLPRISQASGHSQAISASHWPQAPGLVPMSGPWSSSLALAIGTYRKGGLFLSLSPSFPLSLLFYPWNQWE